MAPSPLEPFQTRANLDPGLVLKGLLKVLGERVPDVRGAAIADGNGLPIASTFESRLDVTIASAMSTLTMNVSGEVLRNFGGGPHEFTVVEGRDSIVIVARLPGTDMGLIVHLAPGANLGLVKMELARLEAEILQTLDL